MESPGVKDSSLPSNPSPAESSNLTSAVQRGTSPAEDRQPQVPIPSNPNSKPNGSPKVNQRRGRQYSPVHGNKPTPEESGQQRQQHQHSYYRLPPLNSFPPPPPPPAEPHSIMQPFAPPSAYFRSFPSSSQSSFVGLSGQTVMQGGSSSQGDSSSSTPANVPSPSQVGVTPSPTAPSPVPPPTTTAPKRKRKAGEGGGSKSKNEAKQSEEDDADKSKRTKTQRACDPCRRKKIRCDVIVDSEPPICQHCKQYGVACTFYLPITETRFKKKRMEESAPAVASSSSSVSHAPPPPPTVLKREQVEPQDRIEEDMQPRGTMSPVEGSRGEVKIYGPTSLSFIMHSTPSLPVRIFESYDQRYHQTWEVGKSGDGFIQVMDPCAQPVHTALPKPIEYRLDRDTLASLINAYFREVAPQFPIVSEAEFLSSTSPPPVLLYAICSVAAARRGVPQEIFDSLRMAVNQVIRAEDVLSTASIVNLQALLILGMSGDVHSASITSGMTAAWLRLGAAIRMAQDLGLYRAEAVKVHVDLRRRLWGACVIADRWYGAAYGHPFMIDVLDCDVRLPTPDDPNDPETQLTKPNCYLAELIKLSILLGKVIKTIYSPSGLVHATDPILETLLGELDQWKANLRPDLAFTGPNSILPAGLLHLFYSCVCMMFWRVFLRLSYSCPEHLKFSLTVSRWTELVKVSRESIDWLDANEHCYDSWIMVAYAASSCALVQYHTWARRRDQEAAASLRKLRDCVQRWERSLQPGHLSSRRKTSEIITLLYEATQIPDAMRLRPNDRPRLNPTVGVHDHIIGQETFKRLEFRKDPSRPGGGVFVANARAVKDAVSDVPEGTVVVEAEIRRANGEPVDGEVSVPTGAASLLLNITPGQQLNPSGRFGLPLMPEAGLGDGGVAGNVNPTMNFNYGDAATVGGGAGWTNEVTVLNLLDQEPVNATDAYQVLDGIPADVFSWDGWDEYFARLGATGGQPFPSAFAPTSLGTGAVPSSSVG